MPSPEIRKIVMIGAGNLATNMALAMKKSGYNIIQVYNRTPYNGTKLATRCSSNYVASLSNLTDKADLYVVSIADSAINEVVEQIYFPDKFIIHTSGSVGLTVLKKSSFNYGIIYPPQTFTKDNIISFRHVPICIEANNRINENLLLTFAHTLSDNVRCVTSSQREIIHLSAVFASNFPHFLHSVAEDLLRMNDLSMEILEPIIKQTAANVKKGNLRHLQTGPAKRRDQNVIENHLDLLSHFPDYKKIYELLSRSIIKSDTKNDKLQRTP